MSWGRHSVALTFVGLAVLLALAFGVAHALGLREHTTILSGTLPPGVDLESAQAGAGVYLLTWFGWVLGTPILLIAAGVATLLERRNAAASASA